MTWKIQRKNKKNLYIPIFLPFLCILLQLHAVVSWWQIHHTSTSPRREANVRWGLLIQSPRVPGIWPLWINIVWQIIILITHWDKVYMWCSEWAHTQSTCYHNPSILLKRLFQKVKITTVNDTLLYSISSLWCISMWHPLTLSSHCSHSWTGGISHLSSQVHC